MGFTAVQALAAAGVRVYAWDTTADLLAVNPATGAATDLFPGIGTGGADIQFLMFHSDGRLLGGRTQLYEIDRTTGVPTVIGPIVGGTLDVRGAEERFGIRQPFGTGCRGVAPSAVQLGVGLPPVTAGIPTAGHPITFLSSGHAAVAAGVLVLGFSARQAMGQPLPLLLDPLLGTVGCRLLVSPDLTSLQFCQANGDFYTSLTLPPGSEGLAFFAQHAVFDPVPGGMSWSDGIFVHVRP
jgi:hypothetical protein